MMVFNVVASNPFCNVQMFTIFNAHHMILFIFIFFLFSFCTVFRWVIYERVAKGDEINDVFFFFSFKRKQKSRQ